MDLNTASNWAQLLSGALCVAVFAWGIIVGAQRLFQVRRITQDRDDWRTRAEAQEKIIQPLLRSAETLETLASGMLALRGEVNELRAVQIVTTRYIVDLVLHIRQEGVDENMPEIPREISDDVLAQIRAREVAHP